MGGIPTYIIGEFITPHAHAREGGYVIGAGVYIYMFVDQIFLGSNLSNQLTFSNIHGRTSPRIYRLALPLHAPETLSSSSKSRISYIMRTLLYLSGWMTQIPAQMHR